MSEELLALRGESRRVAAEQLRRGAVLGSTAGASVAQEIEAKALLLRSRLDDVQATAEMDEAIGRTPQLECFVADGPAESTGTTDGRFGDRQLTGDHTCRPQRPAPSFYIGKYS